MPETNIDALLFEDGAAWLAEDGVPVWAESGVAGAPGEPVYTPILVVTMPPPYVGHASTARNRSGVDPRSSTIRDRVVEQIEA
jgi:hypothetical protein